MRRDECLLYLHPQPAADLLSSHFLFPPYPLLLSCSRRPPLDPSSHRRWPRSRLLLLPMVSSALGSPPVGGSSNFHPHRRPLRPPPSPSYSCSTVSETPTVPCCSSRGQGRPKDGRSRTEPRKRGSASLFGLQRAHFQGLLRRSRHPAPRLARLSLEPEPEPVRKPCERGS
jgi:hypothetical protein